MEANKNLQRGNLILENGECYQGCLQTGFEGVGEVVFNTSHSGYQEVATDPSYFKQIVVMTAPMQGNYGVSDKHQESSKMHLSGYICLEAQKSKRDQSWLKTLETQNISVLSDVDTRALTLSLREQGVIWGGVFQNPDVEVALKKIALEKAKWAFQDWTAQVAVSEPETYNGEGKQHHIGLLDFGYKKSILRELLKRVAKVTVLSPEISLAELESLDLDGLLLSNGPGDPDKVEACSIKLIQDCIGKWPIMGICMGHQLLGRALGLSTFKLKYGHRGANHPIKDLRTGQVFMSSQNHGYAICSDFSVCGVEVSHVNLNDQTVAGIELKDKFCFSVQFHPESAPGPHEARYLFDEFISLILNFKSCV